MIAYLKGELISVSEDNLVMEVNSIGYNVKISTGMASSLPQIGKTMKVHIYTYVREDAFVLYGFLSLDDLDIFKKLITVNGIGPKGALAILSVMSADDLKFAIIAGDGKAISKAPGVGLKTAERVILDLRDKVSMEDTFVGKEQSLSGGIDGIDNRAKGEAIEALVSLGYSPSEAIKAMKLVEISEEMNSEMILKLALTKIAFL